ncbi:MAG: hypothetical protein ACRD63_10525, partial [Pyrinomonadaceae bacterium]
MQTKLRTKVENYTIAADTFLQALTRVAAKFEIPMGFEWVKAPDTLRSINRSWQRATVYQIIESLVKAQPGYDFRISNGVVHVFPHGSLTDEHNFLNIRIDKFEVQNEFVEVASERLRSRVRGLIRQPPPSPPGARQTGKGVAGSMVIDMRDRQVSFRLVNSTVRDVLDKLSLAAGFKIWVVTYPETPTFTNAGFRRTSSLYTDNIIPDENQPIWRLLLWNDKYSIE